MQAATAVFAEKGFDAATMTEVAERASTAIGSLYRFFPNKEALAAALFVRFREVSRASLDGILAIAATATPIELACAFTRHVRSRHALQSAVLAVIDGHEPDERLRLEARAEMRAAIADILRLFTPGLSKAKSEASAAAVSHVLKAVTRFIDEGTPKLIGELEHMLQLYFVDLKKR